MTISRDLSELSPIAWPAFARLERRLLETPFRVFECWRSPARQRELLQLKRTKAGPWRSAHQYGLAVDFVPFIDGAWTWEVGRPTWDLLRLEARAVGLLCELDWDRAHVEHPAFAELRKAMRF